MRKCFFFLYLFLIKSDSCALEQEVRGYRQDIINDQSRYHYLNAMLNVSEISLDRGKKKKN